MQLNKTEALSQAQQFIDQGRVSSAISIYQKIVKTDSSDLAAISTLGDLYVKAGRIPEAVDHFLKIGENYLRSGSAISAVYILKKILLLDPSNPLAHLHLGELSLIEMKIDQAHTHFIEAGAAYWHKGDNAAAIKMNERALAVIPDSRQAKAALTLLKQELKHAESPEPPKPKPITPELELQPILISIPDDSDHARIQEPAQDNHPLPELVSGFSELLLDQNFVNNLDEDAIVERIARAELLVAYGEVDQATALLRESLQYRPDHIEIRVKLKDIYLRSEMSDRASEECLNIAGIHAARGETDRAREYVMRARALTQPVERSEAASYLN